MAQSQESLSQNTGKLIIEEKSGVQARACREGCLVSLQVRVTCTLR